MLESRIQRAIISYLESLGAYVVNVVKAGKAGTPDIVCCVYGLFVGIEVKRPGHEPRPLQEYHLKKIGEAQGHTLVATCVQDVQEFVANLSKWSADE